MTTKQMEILSELASTLNFNKAANNLFVSQPTLTYQIKQIENEVGFLIFNRNGKSVSLTPAGRKFTNEIKRIYIEIKNSIEQAQNMSSKYNEEIKIGLRFLTSLKKLPDSIISFGSKNKNISITPYFDNELIVENFLRGDYDCIFALKEQVEHIPNVYLHPLYDADICLICRKDDPLANKEKVLPEDLKGRTLLVGRASSHTLRKAQQLVIDSVSVKQLNSPNHNATIINVLSNKAICLSPTYYKEDNDSVAWIPFEFKEKIPCVICTKTNDNKALNNFIEELQKAYGIN